MSRYKRIILLAGFFSFIGVGFSNGLLLKKNTLVEEVIEYDEVVRKVKKSQRKPAGIHSKKHKTIVTTGELPFASGTAITTSEVQPNEHFAANNETFDGNISGSVSGNSASAAPAYYPQSLGQGFPTESADSYPVAPSVAAGSSVATTGSSSANLGGGMSFGNVNTGDSTNQGSGVSIYKVHAIQMKNGRLIVTGNNLHTVKNLTLKSKNDSISLSKISASSSELVAMGMDAFKLITGKVYSLIIADAYGSSTYPISIELADGAVTMRKLAPLGASEDGYILKWDAGSSSWIAAPDEVGAGPDGGITSITKGAGILGEGASITTVGSIAVDVGTAEGQIPQFNADKKLVLQSDNKISFTENTEEFVFGMFAEVFKLRNQTNDRDIFSVVGNDFLVRGQQVCLSDGTNCPAAGAAVSSISVAAPLTSSGTTSVSLGLAFDNTTLGLNGSSQLSILNGGVTASKLHQMGATTNQVLKWNGSAWTPAADTDTGITAESDPTVRKFARNDLNGIAPTACDADESMTYASALDTLVCQPIAIDVSQVTGLNQFWETATGGINYAGGRVGIGTATPNVILDVRGSAQVGNSGSSSSANWPFFISDSSNLGWKVADGTGNPKFELYAGYMGLNQMRLINGVTLNAHMQDLTLGATGALSAITVKQTTGKIGIGTTAPETGLQVQASRWNTDINAPQLGIVGSRASLGFYDNNQAGANVFVLENGEEQFHLYSTTHTTNDWGYDEKVSRLTVLGANGNVGIGVTSPTTKLEVDGIIKATGFQGPMSSTSVSSGTGTAAAPAYTFSNGTNTGLFSTSAGSIGISSGGAQTFNFNSYGLLSTTPGGASINSANGTAGTPTFSFSGDADTGWFRPAANTMAASTGGVERVRIDSNGRLGVGAGSPLFPLHVNAGGGNNRAVAINHSDLGPALGFIGTASQQFFRIDGDNSGGSPTNRLRFLSATGSTGSEVFSERMTILQNGNVGIGVLAPKAKLEVDGAIIGKAAVSNSTEVIDFLKGNQQYSASRCGDFTLHNLKDGGSYAFAVQATAVGLCAFQAFSDAGTTELTVKMPPNHGNTILGTHTLYNFMVMGSFVYVSWTPGY